MQFFSVVRELRGRFAQFMKTGDDSMIPADLLKVTFQVVSEMASKINDILTLQKAVRHGHRAEYDAALAVLNKPKTPTQGMAAMYVGAP